MKKKIYRGTIFVLLIINIIGNCVAFFSILGALGMIITALAVISLPLWNEDILFKTAEQLEIERDAHFKSKQLYAKFLKQKSRSTSSRPK